MPELTLAVDVGTSTTVAAMWFDGNARLVAVDGYPWIPSAIYFDETRGLLTGIDALRMARVDPSRFEPNPKLRVGEGDLLLGAEPISIIDALAAIINTCVTEAVRQNNGRQPDTLVLTHPADWGSARRAVLQQAGSKFVKQVHLVPEPVAAAARLRTIGAVESTDPLAIYDLGAGTFDAAVVGPGLATDHILAFAGLADFGGADLDQALSRLVLERTGTTPSQLTDIWGIDTSELRRRLAVMRDDVRLAKEALSRLAHTDIPMPSPLRDIHLTRAELEDVAEPLLARTIDVLAATIDQAKVESPTIFLVGGASRMPLCATLISQRFGTVPVALDQPESLVALGAAGMFAGLSTVSDLADSAINRPTEIALPRRSSVRRRSLLAMGLIAAMGAGAFGYTTLSDNPAQPLNKNQAQELVRRVVPPEQFSADLKPFASENSAFLRDGFHNDASTVACTASSTPPTQAEKEGRVAAVNAQFTEAAEPTVTRYRDLLVLDVEYLKPQSRARALSDVRTTVAQCIRDGLPNLTEVALPTDIPTPKGRQWIAFRAKSNLAQSIGSPPITITCFAEQAGSVVYRACGTSAKSTIAADLLAIRGINALHDRAHAMGLGS